ncbi:MAG: fibronectin type III domain-containing protein [Bacteroidia bacterium]|nr:fibronectin type III domain-containing protein [Bacteroidia bacterium]
MKHNNSLRSAFFLQALFLFVVSISFGQTNILSGISNGNSKSTSTSNASVTRMDSSSTENFVSTAAWFRTSGSCAAPNGVSSTVLSSTSARLNWTAKTGIMYYNFRYRRTGTSSWTYDSTITNSKTIYGLAASTSYDYQIQTRCNSSSTSGYGTRKTFTTTVATVNCGTPNVALFGTINKTASSATVYWTGVSGALSYNVRYRVNGSSSAWTIVPASTVNANLTGLSASTQYEFQVQSVCSAGSSSYSSSGIFSTNASCGIPATASFTSTAITSSSATLGWSAVTGATGYNIQYRVNGSGSTWTAANSTTTSKNVTGLSSATTYEFQVQTICAGGNSAFSASGIFTTTIAITCGVPDVNFFTATDKTATSCTVGWAAVSGATGYNVQYRVRNSGSAWNTVNVTSTSANLSSLSALTQYEFQVQTICSGGVGAYSASGIFTTISATATCGVPTGLNVTGITTSAATLGWTSASGATSYNIQYRKSGTTSWTNTTSTSAWKTVSGLLATSAYEFQVQTVCSGGTSSFSSSTIFTTLTSGVVSLPVPDHIVVVMFENHAYHEIIGNSAAPRINAFAAEANTTLFTESYGIEHPSQPNYLDIFAGGNQGVTNNVKPSSKFTSMNLAAALQQAGLTFISYSDGMPSVGYDGDVSGTYARKHNAVANWVGTGTNQVSSSLNQPFTSFPTDYSTLPTVSFVNPDMNHSMHDGSGNTAITNGDNWFYSKIYPYAQWAKTHNSLLIFTFDEDNMVSGNRIPTIFAGQMVTQGQIATGVNHYNVLRTIEDMYGLVHSGNAANASPIHGCWTNGFRVNTNVSEIATDFNLNLFPNPAVDVLNISYTLEEDANVSIRLISVTGASVAEKLNSTQESGNHDVALPISHLNLSKGIYFVELLVNEKRIVKRIMID